MKKTVLAICDSDAGYVMRLQEYLRNNLQLSFEIISFTESSKLIEYLGGNVVSLLIITSRELSKMDEEAMERAVRNTIVLWDEEAPSAKEDKTVRYVSRLCPASEIVRKVIEICMERADDFNGLTHTGLTTGHKVIGLFTPISGCGQSELAISIGKELSSKGRSILVSFESFSRLSLQTEGSTKEDLTDLMYIAECNPDSFGLYLERMLIRMEGIDIVPPAGTAMQIKEINASKVKLLIDLLSEKGGYEYIILDLKEYPDGFLDILSGCDIIYTITGESDEEQQRIAMYNRTLIENGYEDVAEKTVKCRSLVRKVTAPAPVSAAALIQKGREVLELGT